MLPDGITDQLAIRTIVDISIIREERQRIKEATEALGQLRHMDFDHPECGANITLAYRHLEDAAMRLGKAIQALDGGVSVYDKAEVAAVEDFVDKAAGGLLAKYERTAANDG